MWHHDSMAHPARNGGYAGKRLGGTRSAHHLVLDVRSSADPDVPQAERRSGDRPSSSPPDNSVPQTILHGTLRVPDAAVRDGRAARAAVGIGVRRLLPGLLWVEVSS